MSADTPRLVLAGEYGGRAQVMHGAICVGLVIHDKPGLVMTPNEARELAAMLVHQADASDAESASILPDHLPDNDESRGHEPVA